MYTISQIGTLFRLSRSTLLYYDSIGLLSPSQRSPAGYRLYAEDDRKRLGQIRVFRDLGVPLKGIRSFLERKTHVATPVLLKRLLAINSQIDELRDQQRAILAMIETEGILKGAKPLLRRTPSSAGRPASRRRTTAACIAFSREPRRQSTRGSCGTWDSLQRKSALW